MKAFAFVFIPFFFISSCAVFEQRRDGSLEGDSSNQNHYLKTKKFDGLVKYPTSSPDGIFTFSVFGQSDPQWDPNNKLGLIIPLGENQDPIQCSFSLDRMPLAKTLSQINLEDPFLGLGDLEVSHQGVYPSLYVEKIYDISGEGRLQALKVMALDLERATVACWGRGTSKENFVLVMQSIGESLQVNIPMADKKLLALSVWDLRQDNFPRGLIIERKYRRFDGLIEIVREKSELFELEDRSSSIVESVMQIKSKKRKESLSFFKKEQDGKNIYQLALRPLGDWNYKAMGHIRGRKLDFKIEADKSILDFSERRKLMARKLPSFSYSAYSPDINPLSFSIVSGRRFGDPRVQCLYLLKDAFGVSELRCDKSGKIVEFRAKKSKRGKGYSGKLIYQRAIKSPFK